MLNTAFRALSMVVFLAATSAVTARASSLQSKMDSVLGSDPRNAGIKVAVGYQQDRSVLRYDLTSVEGTKSMADVFRVFLQFAQAEKTESFKSVELAFRGHVKFRLSGECFARLGAEYGSQNPVYTMRTFPENLMNVDGSRAYPIWNGGLIGVVGKQTEDFNDFHRQWWLNDVLGLRNGVPSPVLTAVVQAPFPKGGTNATSEQPLAPRATQGVVPPANNLPLAMPDWLKPFPGAAYDSDGGTSPAAPTSYTATATPAVVIEHYSAGMRADGVNFQRNFDGLGTTLHATAQSASCVVRIREADAGGTQIKVACAPDSGAPAGVLAASRATVSGSASALRPTAPLAKSYMDAAPLQVDYIVDGSAETADLTIRNSRGATEQGTVRLPYHQRFNALRDSFLYLSAQKAGESGTVHVVIRVSGLTVYEATTQRPFGIATASGRIPEGMPRIIN